MELADLIRYENECSYLDFKRIQYKKDVYVDFIKDILAFANSLTSSNSRYIIVGVEYKNNGERIVNGIEEEFVDEAKYQQIIRDNIEPSINFKYFPFVIDTKRVGVFEIYDNEDRPYLMKKNYIELKIGDGFIRKGTSNSKISRNDLDQFIEKKLLNNSYSGQLQVELLINNNNTAIIEKIELKDLPSTKEVKKIEEIIKEKEDRVHIVKPLNNLPKYIFDPDYAHKTIEELKEEKLSIEKKFKDEDFYFVCELNSVKLDFEVLNLGNNYIEDASIKVIIPNSDGLYVADRIYHKPERGYALSMLKQTYTMNGYPRVEKSEKETTIFEHIGDIKHMIKTKAFGRALRITISKAYLSSSLNLNVYIFAKNLRKPLQKEILITVK